MSASHQRHESSMCCDGSEINNRFDSEFHVAAKDENGLGGSADLLRLQDWTSQHSEILSDCIHHLVQGRVRSQPEAPAVSAWDGQLSYGELDELSSSLAGRLADCGVGPEEFVPIYLESSCRVPVAVLGVLKAGGAFVLLDSSHDMSILEDICHIVGAKIILASGGTAARAAVLANRVVIIDGKPAMAGAALSAVKIMPSRVAYATFTPGNSGRPEGVYIHQQALCSGAKALAKAIDTRAGSRVLQLASHASDVCITEMLAALIVGACVCIESEQDRTRDLSRAVLKPCDRTEYDDTPPSSLVPESEDCDAADRVSMDQRIHVSDFPLLTYSDAEINDFLTNTVATLNAGSLEVQDAYPCSPIQQDIILGQAAIGGQHRYGNRWLWSTTSLEALDVDPDRLDEAWRQVLRKHPLLRTVIFESHRRDGSHDQVVLKEAAPESCVILPKSDDPRKTLESYRFDTSRLSLSNRLAICASTEGHVSCLLELDLALVDSLSRKVLLRDLVLAYDRLLSVTPQPTYRAYVEHLAGLPSGESMTYWRRHLASAEACMFPASPTRQPHRDVPVKHVHDLRLSLGRALDRFCETHGLTLANVLQLAWAMVLRLYLNADSACFGYMTSGRDEPVADIDSAVGPFANLIICYMEMAEDHTVMDLLYQNHAKLAQSLVHHHTPKEDKMKAAKASGTTLFNTLLCVDNDMGHPPDGASLVIQEIQLSFSTEYDVILDIRALEDDCLEVSLAYHPSFMSDEQAENVADAFQHALQSIVADPLQAIGSVNLLGDLGKSRIHEYNRQEAQPRNACVDHLIEQRCREQPCAPAVHAWDGDFTYAELDELATVVAVELRRRGVGPNQFVALCFEKSRWTLVALLAVLKAGGAFMLLDASHPVMRLQDICRDAGASVVLSSKLHANLAVSLAPEVVVVDERVAGWREYARDASSDGIVRDPSDAVFIIFTSGSTGKPKGSVIEHRAFSSSAMAHSKAFLMDNTSRVLQFSSYAFDVAVLELVTTLIVGGCVCVPSDVQRHDVAKSVATLQVNWAVLTPSVLRVLHPSDFKSLRTLVCGGEAISPRELDMWRSRVNLIIGYGPSECAIVSLAWMVPREISNSRNLGRPVGCGIWVVHPNDANQLLPIGAIGELLIEGPTVGRGYLNRPEKTAEAFIDPPSWLVEFRGKSSGRVYKSGDLVRYGLDGELMFVSRKDSQVKLRGHRIELGEIESHLRSSFPDSGDAVVDIVRPGDEDRQPILVAFICRKDKKEGGTSESKAEFSAKSLFEAPNQDFSLFAQSAEDQMAQSLPTYMVPAVFLPLRYMPMTGTGKTDRKKLREAAAQFTAEELEQYGRHSTAVAEMPVTETDTLIQRVWMRVLNRDASSVGIHRSFFGLGGDSITAMQVAAQCSAEGLNVTVADIFRHRTISALSQAVTAATTMPALAVETQTDVAFPLSPIQSMFFDCAAPDALDHFNHGLLFRVNGHVGSDSMSEAVNKLMTRHHMLRARFKKSVVGRLGAGTWQQAIPSKVEGSYRYVEHVVSSLGESRLIMQASQVSLNLREGPMFSVDLINAASGDQYLFMVAHQLVADSASWMIILEDLGDILSSGTMMSQPSFSFQAWSRRWQEYAARRPEPERLLAGSTDPIPPPMLEYWGASEGSHVSGDETRSDFMLSEEVTRALLGSANNAFQTEPAEVLEAALLHAFVSTFTDRPPPAIFARGRGRQSWDSSIDVTNTVGWFETISPTYIESREVADILRQTKDQRRRLRGNEWGYFARSGNDGPVEVLFDYADTHSQPEEERSDALLSVVNDLQDGVLDATGVGHCRPLPPFALFDVMASCPDQQLKFHFICNRHAAETRPIDQWIANFQETLCHLASILPSQPSVCSLSDFPLLPFSYATLDDFVTKTLPAHELSMDDVEDVYPCTPLQEGLVALVAKRPGCYITTFEYQLADGVDADRFMAAWDLVATANSILRTRIMLADPSGSLQVVVRQGPRWQVFETKEAFEAHIRLVSMGLGDELVHFSLVKPNEGSRAFTSFHLTLHHSLYDGGSMPRLWTQVQAAYKGTPPNPQPFKKFIEYAATTQGCDDFWRRQFEGLDAPIFPALPSSHYIPEPSSALKHAISGIHMEATEFTAAATMRLAWAIVMSCYTDSEEVLYGLTVNGRSAPVTGIQDMTGPTFATFPARVRVRKSETVAQALTSMQAGDVAMMPFQHFGMQNIRRLSQEAATACDFQCHIAVQTPAGMTDNELLAGVLSDHYDYGAYSNYALVVVCHLPAEGCSSILVSASYDSSIVEPSEATRMVQQLEHVLRQLSRARSHSLRLEELDLVSPQDRQQLMEWNVHIPPPQEDCLHHLVLRHAVTRPNGPAISAWDGDMTFGELDSASAVLAQQLQNLGVRPGSMVPLLMDRSKWVIVAMTALHRIGAACVNLDPTHPRDRLQEMIHRTRAKVVLASPLHRDYISLEDKDDETTTIIITVPIITTTEAQPRAEDLSEPLVSPQDAAFIVFTSGSTGKPKGIVMEHVNLASSIHGFGEKTLLDHNTRGLHFASYAFDASIYEIFGTLVNGGCICIPSEFDRTNDVVSFINRHRVNWAIFTPSFVTLLDPDDIPSVRTILLGGEAVTQNNVSTWAPRVNLFNGYGPAESSVCAIGHLPECGWRQGTLGYVTGGIGWITMPSDPSRLAPIGAPGEIAIEGAVVTRGYLDDPERTAASYVTDPAWIRPFRSQDGSDYVSRVFLSGDMAQYNADGSIRYLGRRDTQVKLRGQRIELGEVEHHVRALFPDVSDAVAEVIVPQGGSPTLVAFVANAAVDALETETSQVELFRAPSREFLSQCESATRQLARIVAPYMVPTLYLQLRKIPRTSSDKADRRKLRQAASELSAGQVRHYSGSGVGSYPDKRRPKSEQEKLLQSLWADTFRIPADHIGADDDFFQLGGDSIRAMRLANLARRKGWHLLVPHIFRHPSLSELAQVMTRLETVKSTSEYRLGSLVGADSIEAFFVDNLQGQAHEYQGADVEDILPTTEIQSAFIRNHDITYSRLCINAAVDAERLESVFSALARKHAILRTVFVDHSGDVLQVIVSRAAFRFRILRLSSDSDRDLWEFSDEVIAQQVASGPIPMGSPHFQVMLISRSETEHMLVLRITHAQYDGSSLPALFTELNRAYQGGEVSAESPPFAEYLQYRMSQRVERVYSFWREYLGDAHMTTTQALWRLLPMRGQEEVLLKPMREIPPLATPEGITMSSLVKAAWSVLLARANKSKEIVFGHIINGRDAPLRDVHSISGPCITFSPFKVSLQGDWTVMDLMRHVQAQYTRAMPFANVDFRDIVDNATSWPSDTSLGSVVTHQDAHIDLTGSFNGSQSQWRIYQPVIDPNFHVVSIPMGDRVIVRFVTSSHRAHPDDVERVLDEFCQVLADFSAHPLAVLKF